MEREFVAQHKGRVADEEQAAQQKTARRQDDAQVSLIGVEPERQPQPKQKNGVEERDSDQRPTQQVALRD